MMGNGNGVAIMIEGINDLLARPQRGPECVCRYTAGEMAELFTATDCEAFTRGEVVDRYGVRYVSMVAAARSVLD
jgi:hypothetical protein